MDTQKRPALQILNILMVGLGVVAGGLVICGLLLAYVPAPTPMEGDVDEGCSAESESSNSMDADQSNEIGASDEDLNLMEKYEEDIASGTATAEAYLGFAEYWMDRGDADRAEQVLRQGLEDTGGDADIGKALEELTGEPVAEAASARELRRDTYDEAGGLLWSHVYQYDDRGRQSGVTSYNAAGEQTRYVDILYDADGREIQSYSWISSIGEGGGTVDSVIYRYDAGGRLEREELYFGGDEMDLYVVFQYDQAGRKIRSDSYDPGGTLISYLLYEYDESGKTTQKECYAPNGALEHYSVWVYDAEGKTTEYITYHADGEEEARTTYTYDESGNMVQMENWDLQKKTVTYIQYE